MPAYFQKPPNVAAKRLTSLRVGFKKSLTAYIAQTRTIIRATAEQLAEKPEESSVSKIPYTRACWRYIASGTFYNILGIALVESFTKHNTPCWGVLKVENKKPEDNNGDCVCDRQTVIDHGCKCGGK